MNAKDVMKNCPRNTQARPSRPSRPRSNSAPKSRHLCSRNSSACWPHSTPASTFQPRKIRGHNQTGGREAFASVLWLLPRRPMDPEGSLPAVRRTHQLARCHASEPAFRGGCQRGRCIQNPRPVLRRRSCVSVQASYGPDRQQLGSLLAMANLDPSRHVERAHAARFIFDRTMDDFNKEWAYARVHPECPFEGDPIEFYRGLEAELEWAVEGR